AGRRHRPLLLRAWLHPTGRGTTTPGLTHDPRSSPVLWRIQLHVDGTARTGRPRLSPGRRAAASNKPGGKRAVAAAPVREVDRRRRAGGATEVGGESRPGCRGAGIAHLLGVFRAGLGTTGECQTSENTQKRKG